MATKEEQARATLSGRERHRTDACGHMQYRGGYAHVASQYTVSRNECKLSETTRQTSRTNTNQHIQREAVSSTFNYGMGSLFRASFAVVDRKIDLRRHICRKEQKET